MPPPSRLFDLGVTRVELDLTISTISNQAQAGTRSLTQFSQNVIRSSTQVIGP